MEILLRSLDIISNSRATPGDKQTEATQDAILGDDLVPGAVHEDLEEDVETCVNTVRLRCVDFNTDHETHEIPAYATIYDMHPSTFVFTKHGTKKRLSLHADPYS